MPQTVEAAASSFQAGYRRAVALLQQGNVAVGLELLVRLADSTPDECQRSLCRFNIGEVLHTIGRQDEAYRVWYALAHRPASDRNKFDQMARQKVQVIFEARGLRVRLPDFPTKVQLEVTNRCNLRCIMCTRNQMTRPLGDMSLEVFERVADEVVQEPGTTICLYFLGEPLLNAQLEQMVSGLCRRMRETGAALVFGIQTNGMLLKPERARSLLEAGLRGFTFSVDGLEGDLERIRPGASYPVVERNILGLLEIGRETGLKDLRVSITKLCDDLKADEVRRFQERWHGKVEAIHLSGINKREGNSFMGADGQVHEVQAKGPPVRRKYCGAGQRLLVHWNGDFAFCCSDVNRDIDLGNIRDRSIRETWHSPEIEAVRRKILAANYDGLPVCETCTASSVW